MRCRNCGWENPDTNSNCEKCGVSLDMSSHVNEQVSEPVKKEDSSLLRATIRENEVFVSSANNNSQVESSACACCGYPLTTGTSVCPACGTPVVNKSKGQSDVHFSSNASNGNRENPTVKEQFPSGRHCTNCGTLLSPNVRFCPACGSPVGNNQPQMQKMPKKPYGGTIKSFSMSGMMGMSNFCTLRPIAWDRERIDYQPISYTGERIILNRSNTDANNQTITSHEQASLTFKDGEWYLEDLSANHTTMIRVSRPVKLKDGDIIMLGNRMFEFNE